jgi:hypothetical protein
VTAQRARALNPKSLCCLLVITREDDTIQRGRRAEIPRPAAMWEQKKFTGKKKRGKTEFLEIASSPCLPDEHIRVLIE